MKGFSYRLKGAADVFPYILKSHTVIPLHLLREESLERLQTTVKETFLGEDRVTTKAYLKLFIEKMVINLPRIDISCKTSVLVAALENETAARSCDILAADINWLGRTYSCKNIITTLVVGVEKYRYRGHLDSKISNFTKN